MGQQARRAPKAKRITALLTLGLAASFALVAQPAQAGTSGASGRVTIEGLTLAGTQYGTPSGLPTTETTDPLAIPVAAGDTFKYSTITCASPFPPWNNVGLHFEPDYPGITDPASVRHEFVGRVTSVTSPDHGEIRGIVYTYLCVGDERQDRIVSSYRATFRPSSETSVALQSNPVPTKSGLAFSGSYRAACKQPSTRRRGRSRRCSREGTGRFKDFASAGAIAGQFTRLGTRPGNPGELSPAGYSEVPFQMKGGFRDRTVPGS